MAENKDMKVYNKSESPIYISSDSEQDAPDENVSYEKMNNSGSTNYISSDSEQDAPHENDSDEDSDKWTTLQHNGPYFWKPFETLPLEVLLVYDNLPIKLSVEAEEMAVAYAQTTESERDDCFKKNFFEDWQAVMTPEAKSIIKYIDRCNFNQFREYIDNNPVIIDREIKERHSTCKIDGKVEKIQNWKVERPGLFKGSPGNKKRGKWKRRIVPEEVIINCSSKQKPPAPEGHTWKGFEENKKRLWLAKWPDLMDKSEWKYMQLCRSSVPKAEIDRKKFDVAKKLGKRVHKIQILYREYWTSEKTYDKQLGLALYFIDKFAFRAGNERTDPEDADTVGCCSLRVEHIKLHKMSNDIEFDFSSKGYQQYQRRQEIDAEAFEALQQLIENKQPAEQLFDVITPDIVNNELKKFDKDFSAKVLRTFRASALFEEKLRKTKTIFTKEDNVEIFKEAALAVAELCNHNRKNRKLEREIKDIKNTLETIKNKSSENMLDGLEDHEVKKYIDTLKTLEDKAKSGEPASETAKKNYIDPRIVVAWCKKYDVPINKVYSEKLQTYFKWAIDLAQPDYVFYNQSETDHPRPGPSGQNARKTRQLTIDGFLKPSQASPQNAPT